MKMWYDSILKKIRKLGNNVFIIDKYYLLKVPEIFKSLNDKYIIYEYETDTEFYRFYFQNKGNPLIVYSNNPIKSATIDREFKKLEISLSDVFSTNEDHLIKEIEDIGFEDYQLVFDFLTESKSEYGSFSIKNIIKESKISKLKNNKEKEKITDSIKYKVNEFEKALISATFKDFDINSDLDHLFEVSQKFCEIIYTIQINELKKEDFLDLDKVYMNLELQFKKLVNEEDDQYQKLFFYNYNPTTKKPVTVDKILDYVTKRFKNENIALIVFDGMSYDEWFILKEELSGFNIDESPIFAIIPTITCFSRTAIFSGKTPDKFMRSKTKPNESNEFYSALSEKGYDRKDILYGHIDLKNNLFKTGKENIEFKYLKNYKFLGMICNLFDDISHQDIITCNFKANMYTNMKRELKTSFIIGLLKQLYNDGYKIVITSDHGNIFTKGNGIKSNKNLELGKRQSQRCLIFDKDSSAENLIKANPDKTYRYHYSFIPEEYILVFSSITESFIAKNEYSITHGGISPEELIVPLVILK